MTFTLKIDKFEINEIHLKKIYSKNQPSKLDNRISLINQQILKSGIQFNSIDNFQIKYNLTNSERSIDIRIKTVNGKICNTRFDLNSSDLTHKEKVELFNLRNYVLETKSSIPQSQGQYSSISAQAVLNELILNPSKKSLYKKLTQFNPLDISLEDLLKININKKNKAILAELWLNLLKKCYLNGNLTNLKTSLKTKDCFAQIEYAKKFLNIWDFCPESLLEIEIPENRKSICDFFNETRPTSRKKINSFLKTQSDYIPKLSNDKTNYLIHQLIKSPNNLGLITQLKTLSPLSIPFSELSQIPISEENRHELAELWQTCLGNLFTKGNLKNLNEPLTTISYDKFPYAQKYILAKELVPCELFQIQVHSNANNHTLGSFCTYLERQSSTQLIKNFLLKKSDLNELEININNKKLINLQQTYYAIIHPILEDTLTDYKNKNAVNKLRSLLDTNDNVILNKFVESTKKILSKKIKEKKILTYFSKKTLKLILIKKLKKAFCETNSINSIQKNEGFKVVAKHEVLIKNKKKYPLDENIYCNILHKKVLRKKLLVLKNILYKKNKAFYLSKVKNENKFKEYLNSRVAYDQLIFSTQKNKILKKTIKRINQEFSKETKFLMHCYIEARKIESSIYLNNVLYGEEVGRKDETSIQRSESEFSPQQKSHLRELTRLLNKIKFLNADKITHPNFSTKEIAQLLQILEHCKNDNAFRLKIQRYNMEISRFQDIIMQFFPKFLTSLISYLSPNRHLEKMAAPSRVSGISSECYDFLENFFHITKYSKSLTNIKKTNRKIKRLLDKYCDENRTIYSTERISLKEIGLIGRFQKRGELLEKIAKMGVFDHLSKTTNFSNEWVDLYKTYQTSSENLKRVKRILTPIFEEHYRDGDIVAYNSIKKSSWNGASLNIEGILTGILSNNLVHTGKLFHKGKNKRLHLSEVDGDFEHGAFKLHDFFISDISRIDVAPLLSPCMSKVCKKVLGSSWKSELNKRFQKIEHKLQNELSQSDILIENNALGRIFAGFSVIPLLGKILQIIVSYLLKNIKNEQIPESTQIDIKTNLSSIHEEFFGFDKKGNKQFKIKPVQICSEFTSRQTAATMIQLNKELTKTIMQSKLHKWNPRNVLNFLKNNDIQIPNEIELYLCSNEKRNGFFEKRLTKFLRNNNYSKEDIEIIIRLRNEEIFDLPFANSEDFSLIHPGKLVTILKQKKCIKKIAPPKVLTKLFELEPK